MTAIVVRTGALGDFVATLPVLERVREQAGPITVVANPRWRGLFPAADAWMDADGLDAMRIVGGSARLEHVDVGIAWTRAAAEGLRACGVRQVLHRAREKFVELLRAEVAHSLESATPEEVDEELRELDLLDYCRRD